MNHRTTKHRALTAGALALTAVLALAGCDDDSDSGSGNTVKKPDIKVSGAYVPEPTMADMAAGFFTLTNKGAADKLTSATSDSAGSVTLHSTKGGTMKEEKSFDVPANGELSFTSGGNHVMFEKLAHKPKKGEKVALTLHFQKSDPITVEVPVKEATYNPGQHDSNASHTSHKSH
ncbi:MULTISPECIES: copper chaperone PCu(A)C [Streptomyces]|uniref:Copper chaperone PCu(A)C n=1 Tax=Streptomyces venezuelae TaxID=54571 RepID=A0A5P2CIB7_STRVZ|nr:copper chaperone PCu(A)C [Streptomyces venezuelae]QES42596.1 copper chaperone PCu(A)C [Streptomyces venezuelae]